MKPQVRSAGFPTGTPSKSGAGPPHSKTQAWNGGACILRRVLECAAPAALWRRAKGWFTPRPSLRRYRTMPEKKARAFPREVLANVLHILKRGSTRGR